MNLIGVDPGHTHSAYCVLDAANNKPVAWGYEENAMLLGMLQSGAVGGQKLLLEMVACYGMAVGRETFQTVQIGRAHV